LIVSVITTTAKSLGKYLSVVAGLREQWGVQEHLELWFRAEDLKHYDTRLQPGIYRPRKSGKRKSVNQLLQIDNDLYKEFGRCATQLSASDANAIDDDWDSYFLMQHHGVPTRILDWSDGSLIALHFAINKKKRVPESGSLVYVLDPYWLNDRLGQDSDRKDAIERWKEYVNKRATDYDEDEWERLYLPAEEDEIKDKLLKTPVTPMLWDSPYVTRRIAAQRSRFMIFGTDPLWLVNLSRQRASRLMEIKIPKNAISNIRQELKDAGITESVVFPDFDGLGRELKQVWETRH
jgi:hypothetical protein